MVNSKTSVRKHNKKLNRNLQGLLSKCYKYGKLHGVRLALYIEYVEKGDFVSFESDEQNLGINQITEKKASYRAKNLSPEDVEKKLGILPPQGVRRKTNHQKTGQVSAQAGSKTRRRPELRSFPELPKFDMSVLKAHCKK